jgi:hypothetical protein
MKQLAYYHIKNDCINIGNTLVFSIMLVMCLESTVVII